MLETSSYTLTEIDNSASQAPIGTSRPLEEKQTEDVLLATDRKSKCLAIAYSRNRAFNRILFRYYHYSVSLSPTSNAMQTAGENWPCRIPRPGNDVLVPL
jgi:hypothetical protein